MAACPTLSRARLAGPGRPLEIESLRFELFGFRRFAARFEARSLRQFRMMGPEGYGARLAAGPMPGSRLGSGRAAAGPVTPNAACCRFVARMEATPRRGWGRFPLHAPLVLRGKFLLLLHDIENILPAQKYLSAGGKRDNSLSHHFFR